jgi:hypothetical protein
MAEIMSNLDRPAAANGNRSLINWAPANKQRFHEQQIGNQR